MVINGYFVIRYWWLLMVIILVAIGEYSIVDIGGYFINGYCIISYGWLLYVILQLLMIIVL
jgi:hypothetical protein